MTVAIVNGYATAAQFNRLKSITSTDTTDDDTIADFINRASRLIDTLTQKWFYAYTQTRYFDIPKDLGRTLMLDAPLLSVTTLTNGDGSTIAGSQYYLAPPNSIPYWKIVLNAFIQQPWLISTVTGPEKAIQVAGTWGYCDRTATDPLSMKHINATEFATLQIALYWYQERRGKPDGAAVITGAGVVITPMGAIPKAAWTALKPYMAHT